MGLVRTRALCGATTGKLEVWFCSYASLISRVLRTRYVAPIRIGDTSGGLTGFVLPLSKCLVHRDSEPDRIVPKIGANIIIIYVDRESL